MSLPSPSPNTGSIALLALQPGGVRYSCAIRTEAGPFAPIRVLRVVGELDLVSYPTLRAALTAALFGATDQTTTHLVIDLAGVTFCSAGSYRLLSDAAGIARGAGIDYALAGLAPHLHRLAIVVWGEEHLVSHGSVAGAVTAMRAQQVHAPPGLSGGSADLRGAHQPVGDNLAGHVDHQ